MASSILAALRGAGGSAVAAAQMIEGGRARRAGGGVRRVPAILGEPAQSSLDLLRLEGHEILDQAPTRELAGRAGRGDGRPAAVRLEAHLDRPPLSHAQVEAGEVA